MLTPRDRTTAWLLIVILTVATLMAVRSFAYSLVPPLALGLVTFTGLLVTDFIITIRKSND